MTIAKEDMKVVHVINTKNHPTEELPTLLYRVIQRIVHASALNAQKKLKMKSQKSLFATKKMPTDKPKQYLMIATNQSLLL
jgi:hypothetical protein